MLVRWCAAAEEAEGFCAGIPQLMFLAGWDGDGVAGFHIAEFAFDAHAAGAVGDVVNFFCLGVVMFLRASADG